MEPARFARSSGSDHARRRVTRNAKWAASEHRPIRAIARATADLEWANRRYGKRLAEGPVTGYKSRAAR